MELKIGKNFDKVSEKNWNREVNNLLLLPSPFHCYVFSFWSGSREVGDFFCIFLVFVLPLAPRRKPWLVHEDHKRKDAGGPYKLVGLLFLTSSLKTRKNSKTFFSWPSTSFCFFSQQNQEERWKNAEGRLSRASRLALKKTNKKK